MMRDDTLEKQMRGVINFLLTMILVQQKGE